MLIIINVIRLISIAVQTNIKKVISSIIGVFKEHSIIVYKNKNNQLISAQIIKFNIFLLLYITIKNITNKNKLMFIIHIASINL